ncbi:MAG: arylsulfatase, partial [bacterium]
MKQGPMIGWLLVLTLTLAFCACSSGPPNIVFILADDLGYGEVGCFGQEKIETPNIDKLAAEGMRFTQHYSGSPVCAPSRCVVLTGRHTGHSWVRSNDEWGERGDVWDFEKMVNDPRLEGQRPIPVGTITLGRLLQQAGYETAFVGKWGLGAPGTEGTPNRQGFDFFFGYNCQRQAHTYYPKHLWKNEERVWLENELIPPHTGLKEGADPSDPASYSDFTQKDYSPTLMLEEALGFLERSKNEPFFLYFASTIPHMPLQAPQKWVDYYRKKFGPEEPYLAESRYFPHQSPHAAYAGMVSCLDEQVGQIVEKLEELGLRDNTLILFSSDNGPTYAGGADSQFFESAKPFKSEFGYGKGFVHEGGIRVPTIASWPKRIQPKTVSEHISAFWDLLPTFCEVAGADVPADIDGISFLPAMTGDGVQQEHDFLYWEFPSYEGQQAVRIGDWKGIRKNIFKGNFQVELYNLRADIQEQNNVAAENPEVVARIEEIMKQEHMPSSVERFRMSEFLSALNARI